MTNHGPGQPGPQSKSDMKVKTTHPVTGKTKIVEMTADEYRANKILNPGILIVEDERGFVDESGCRRHTMSREQLQALYKQFENFVADCTKQEYDENKESINAVYALIHKHINAETTN